MIPSLCEEKMGTIRLNRNPKLVFFFSFLVLSSSSIAMTLCNPSSSITGTMPTSPLVSFLQSIQSAALKTFGPSSFDPKLYVDLPLKHALAATQAAFSDLTRSPYDGEIPAPELKEFLARYFEKAASDLVLALPVDFVPEPEGFLPNVENPIVRAWALEVHSLWKNLSRRVSDSVKHHPEMHTLLPLPEPVVVPGSRFREVYYWDSYWTIRSSAILQLFKSSVLFSHNNTPSITFLVLKENLEIEVEGPSQIPKWLPMENDFPNESAIELLLYCHA